MNNKEKNRKPTSLSDRVIQSSVLTNQYSCTQKRSLKKQNLKKKNCEFTGFEEEQSSSVNRKGEDEEVERMRRRIQQRRGEAVVTHVQRQRYCDRAAAARGCWKKGGRL